MRIAIIPYLDKCKMTLNTDNPPMEHICQEKVYLSKSKLTPQK